MLSFKLPFWIRNCYSEKVFRVYVQKYFRNTQMNLNLIDDVGISQRFRELESQFYYSCTISCIHLKSILTHPFLDASCKLNLFGFFSVHFMKPHSRITVEIGQGMVGFVLMNKGINILK